MITRAGDREEGDTRRKRKRRSNYKRKRKRTNKEEEEEKVRATKREGTQAWRTGNGKRREESEGEQGEKEGRLPPRDDHRRESSNLEG